MIAYEDKCMKLKPVYGCLIPVNCVTSYGLFDHTLHNLFGLPMIVIHRYNHLQEVVPTSGML